MSAKRVLPAMDIIDVGSRRLYVKASNGFVLHSGDLTPEELVQSTFDLAQLKARQAPQDLSQSQPPRSTQPAAMDQLPLISW